MKVLIISIIFALFASQALGQDCPPGVPIVSCFVDPCQFASCPGISAATCSPYYCGGCIARWYIGGVEVTDNCTTTSLPECNVSSNCTRSCTSNSSCYQGEICCRSSCGSTCMTVPPPDPCRGIQCDWPICPNNARPISDNTSCCPYCPPDPCENVVCRNISCSDGSTPTIATGDCCPNCTSGFPQSSNCPRPSGGFGTCPVQCTSDSQCSNNSVCCSNGCGRVCTAPITPATCTVYINGSNVTYQAGEAYRSADGCNTCTCTSSGHSLCTLRACPVMCRYNASGTLHFYRPGQNFSSSDGCNTCFCGVGGSVFCTEIYCVPRNCPLQLPDNCAVSCGQSGCPMGKICCFGCCVTPNITCNTSDGRVYQVNETFTAEDGCNTCTCLSNGLAACTRRACPDICSLPAEVGVCEAIIPSYYFNSRTRLCERFNYGGCGGNNNRFLTARDCYRRCNSSSTCISSIYPPNVTLTCLVLIQKWTFNATSGRCQQFSYSPCGQQQNGYNVYDTEEQCNSTCVQRDTGCPTGQPLVYCFADPCSVSSCPRYPNASCVSNYCGGCNAVYYVGEDDVTSRCAAIPVPTPILQPMCPMTANGTLSICLQSCSDDDNCTGNNICCSNGCGRTCVQPDHIPYYEIQPQCPVSLNRSLVGTCVVTDRQCLDDGGCDRDGDLCCRAGCGRQCTQSVTPTQPCYSITDQFLFSPNTSLSLIGRFVPQCDSNGTFLPIQCHASTGYCWCVNTRTGRPTSPFYPRGTTPRCSVCSYNGNTYSDGESFPSSDGCNRCLCDGTTGNVACTLRACINICTLRPDPGPCRAAFPAYFYNTTERACRPFTYGGCQGNDNKFDTIGDCLGRCNSDSVCLPSELTICIDGFGRTGQYVFNATSGQCEEFQFGCTNRHRFDSIQECLTTCNPSSPTMDPCAAVRCAAPNCPRENWIPNVGGCCFRCADCEIDEFQCRSNEQCISSEYVCDGLRDCPDGSDEVNCQSNCGNGHSCADGSCFRRDYVCDGYLDCRDASDERNCSLYPTTGTYYPRQIPLQCPNSTGLIGICVQGCNGSSSCRNDRELCCSNGCGRTCTVGEPASPLCPALGRQQYAFGFGAFVPQCESDGTFSEVQLWASTRYRWCVDIMTGMPVTNATLGTPRCPRCTVNGVQFKYGEQFNHEDGCNTCYCLSQGPVCTREACGDESCFLDDLEINHGQKYEDICSNCNCTSGQLRCIRKICAVAGGSTQRNTIRVRMGFNGKLSELAPTQESRDALKREVMRMFVTMYSPRLGFVQEQITYLEIEEGIVVTMELSEIDQPESANITIMVNQMKQDYSKRSLAIRYRGSVIESGDLFQVDDGDGVDSGGIFPSWAIAVVVIGAVLLVAASLVIVGIIYAVVKRSSASHIAVSNNYEVPLTIKKDLSEEKVPLDNSI